MWILAGTLIKQPTKIEEIEETIEKRPGDCYTTDSTPSMQRKKDMSCNKQNKNQDMR